jgi:hypothetical protein
MSAMKTVIDSVNALWRKAEREALRAVRAESKEHKADHFFNFCVTAHSLRDFFFEQRCIHEKTIRSKYYQSWSREPQLVAVKEIANLSKHFLLRDPRSGELQTPKTKHLVHKKSGRFAVYVTQSGAFTHIPEPARDISITTSDGVQNWLWEFQVDVLDYWREFLRRNGIRVYRQTVEQMLDRPPVA